MEPTILATRAKVPNSTRLKLFDSITSVCLDGTGPVFQEIPCEEISKTETESIDHDSYNFEDLFY